MKILWLCDEPGWAYANVSHTLARAMPQHEHRFLYYKQPHYLDYTWPDICICSHPEVVKHWPQLADKMILRFASRMHNLTPRVLWFCDERGWAYERRAKLLASKLPDYEHHFAYYFDYKTDLERRNVMLKYDITMCMCGPYARLLYGVLDKAVPCISGFRILDVMGIRVKYA